MLHIDRAQRDAAKRAAATLLDIPYSREKPTQRQARFLLYFGLEALYGGAAGGGKSSSLLMGALQFIHVPNYAALILRRNYTDLTQAGALMDRAQQWFGLTDARWKAQEHKWVFPSGASITFGYLATDADKYRYQSAEFQYIAFDELTQFTESQYRFLFSRLRKPEGTHYEPSSRGIPPDDDPLTKVPLRMRSATNPGGRGHEWVRRRFIDSESSNRRFFKATLKDNPHVNEKSYRTALKQLDPVTRAQMEEGNWDIKPAGNMFKRHWFPIVENAPKAAKRQRVRYWDLAASDKASSDYTAGALCSISEAGLFVVEHIRRFQTTPHEVEENVKAHAMADGTDVPIWIEQEPGSGSKSLISHYRRNVLHGYTVKPHPKRSDKIAAASPWSARAEPGEVLLVRGDWIDGFLDEAEAFPEVEHDDRVDAVSGAYAVLAGTDRKRARLIV